MSHSRLAHWPPPQRDVEVKAELPQADDPLQPATKQPVRRHWHLKSPTR